MSPDFPVNTDGLPPPWPRKKRLRHRRRDYLWRFRAFMQRGKRDTRKNLLSDPNFPDLAVATIALTPKYHDWCLSMIDSLRNSGAYAGPVYVVTESPEQFEALDNVAAITVPATSHRLIIKSFKALLPRWLPSANYLYIDADVVVTEPLKDWYATVREHLVEHPLLTYPAGNPVPGAYHGGLLLAARERVRPFMDRWLYMLRHGYHHSDQVCLKAIADPAYLDYFPDRDFVYLYRCLAPQAGEEAVSPRRFVHVTNGMITDHSPEELKSYMRETLGLRRLPNFFG